MILIRKEVESYGVFSELTEDNGAHFCVTAEHSYLNPDGSYSPKIPPGKYNCVRGMHRLEHMKEPFETFEITGVEGHSQLLFHVGNWPNIDSDGCVLTGEFIGTAAKNEKLVTNSRITFKKFMDSKIGVNEFWLTVE